MLKNLSMGIIVGLVSGLVVVTIAQEVWGIDWSQSVILGGVVFVLGIVTTQMARRMVPADEDWGKPEDE